MTTPARSEPTARPMRDARPRGVLCPFCGEVSPDVRQCRGCRAYLDPLSRQATQNEMGPWFIRDTSQPFRPGCSYQTITRLIQRGRLGAMSVIRGPTTRQAWSFAGRTPSVANLLGLCHNCQREVAPDAFACPACGASFAAETDRQHLGLAPVHLLPGQASPETIAASVIPTPRAHHGSTGVPQPTLAPSGAGRVSDPMPEQLLALQSTIGRLRAGMVIALMLALSLAGALAASLAGVLKWPDGTRAVPAPVDPASSAGNAPRSNQPSEAPGVDPSTPGGEAVESVRPETAPVELAPPTPLGLGPQAEADLALLADSDADPEAIRRAVLDAGGSEADARSWLASAARRRDLIRLRALP